jgi:ABC-type branched-subunit amino acid transport system substrate-binding protein
MPRLTAFIDHIVRLARGLFSGRAGGPPVRPRSWPHRHPLIVSIPAVLLVASGLWMWSPWQQCGAGLRSAGSVCVGLDLGSTALQNNDPLADLENLIAARNDHIHGDFKTIVLLENLTADPNTDSTPMRFVRHEVEGAIAALPDTGPPQIKLLLANFGGNADYWRDAVDQIVSASTSQHIVAVTAVGLSLDNTRNAVADLSKHGIATIGATVTADDMNMDLDKKPIENFFRVGPTNTDEANAAADYMKKLPHQRVMLIADTGETDSYAATLASAFQKQTKLQITHTKTYKYTPLADISRDRYLRALFGRMHADICSAQPDIIYFAGRGVDLGSFVSALAGEGACQQLPSVRVLTGDDAATLIGSPLRLTENIRAEVLYTALAYPGQWDMFFQDPAYQTLHRNYEAFVNKFTANKFSQSDLRDGAAMIEHDAVATAARAAADDPSSDPKSIANFLLRFGCNSGVPGATGFIAFQQNTGNQIGKGNQIDKAMPILRFNDDGSTTQADLVWSQGHPLDTSSTCGS